MRFTGDKIGIDGDPDLITLTDGVVTINGKIIHTGTTDHSGDFEVGTDKFNVASNTGNTAIAGTLDVTGATSLGNTLNVTGNLNVGSNKFTVAALTGDTYSAGTLNVAGATTLSNTLTVAQATDLNSNLDVGGYIKVASTCLLYTSPSPRDS